MGSCMTPQEKTPPIPPRATNEETDAKTEESSISQLPLPGQCDIKCTYDLMTDLQTLKTKYGDKYQELIHREFVDVKCDNVNADTIASRSITVMQFKLSMD